MEPPLDANIEDEVTAILKTVFRPKTPAQRLALVRSALESSPVVDALEYNGGIDDFIRQLIQALHDFGTTKTGEPALWMLLKGVRKSVGKDIQERINRLESHFRTAGSPDGPAQPTAPPPKLASTDSLSETSEIQRIPLKALGIDSGESVSYSVIVNFTTSQDKAVRLRLVLEELREISGDASIIILESKAGSLRVDIRGTRSGFETLKRAFNSGLLSERLGGEVVALRRRQLVVLVHGIRTQAEWHSTVKGILQDDTITVVKPLGYGYFDAFSFWFPFLLRRRPVSTLQRELRDIIAIYKSDYRELVIVAHSFGTYAVTQILKKDRDIIPDRLLLCGSIVREDFDWKGLPNCPREILNEVGTRDIWPIMAKMLSWGYGATGTFGFKKAVVEDRYHNIRHSDYFKNKFPETYWKPWVREDRYVASPFEIGQRPATSLWKSLAVKIPVQWILTLTLLAWITWCLINGPIQKYIQHVAEVRLQNLSVRIDDAEYTRTFHFSDDDLSAVDDALSEDEPERLRMAIRIISSYDELKREYKHRFGARLTLLLDNTWIGISPSGRLFLVDQISVLDTLFDLSYSESQNLLIGAVHDPKIDQSVRTHILKGLPRILGSEVTVETLERITKDLGNYRSTNKETYELQLQLLYRYSPVRGLKELESLIELGRQTDVVLVSRFFQSVCEKNASDSPSKFILNDPGGVQKAHIDVLSRLLIKGTIKFGFSPELWDQKSHDAKEPRVVLYVEIDRRGKGFQLSLDELESTVFILAVAAAVKDLEDSETDDYHREVLDPIIELGRFQFEHEKAIGKLGREADPMRWQGGFVLDWVTNDPFEVDGLTIQPTKLVEVRVDDYDFQVNEGSFDFIVSFKEADDQVSKKMQVPLETLRKGILHWKFRFQREKNPD